MEMLITEQGPPAATQLYPVLGVGVTGVRQERHHVGGVNQVPHFIQGCLTTLQLPLTTTGFQQQQGISHGGMHGLCIIHWACVGDGVRSGPRGEGGEGDAG